MRVLIVEDEVRLAETLRDLLELERYTADTVSYTHLTLPTKA